MVLKSMFFREIIRTSSKGFTLVELIVASSIGLTVIALALQAFISSAKQFQESTSSFQNTRDLSSAVNYIGADIRLLGDGIQDSNFPALSFFNNTDLGAMPGSSKLVIRRAPVPLILNLCQDLFANQNPTSLVVSDDTVGGLQPNCIGNLVSGYPILPEFLRQIRNFRCQLNSPNPNWKTAERDNCFTGGNKEQRLYAAVTDGIGHFRTFTIDDEVAGSNYSIAIGSSISKDPFNSAIDYRVGSAIYPIEERIYTLDNSGNLNVVINGAEPVLFMPNIQQFKVQGKIYSDLEKKVINESPGVSNFACIDDKSRVCQFNFTEAGAAPVNWKAVAALQLTVQGKYSGVGKSLTPSKADLEALTVNAEFFPRNSNSVSR